jgi:hypothetical protein
VKKLKGLIQEYLMKTEMNYVFGDDLKFFVKHHLPSLPNRDKIAEHLTKNNALVTVDEAIRAWVEHDALHYLSQQPFTKEGEEYVAYLEKTFNCGWLPLGEKYNTFKPKECECSHITQELITQTAEQILIHTNARIKRHKKEKIRQIEKRKLTRMCGK